MQNNFLDNQPFPSLRRTAQLNNYYCGPASLQMLLNFYQIEVNQEEIVSALQIGNKIETHGITIEEMGNYIKQFQPQVQFWYKFGSGISDLQTLINEFKIPVGIEWQGVFDYPDEENTEEEDDDPGHISLITAVNTSDNYVLIADPFPYYAGTDRKFSVLQFVRRWWDIDEVIDPITGKRREVDNYRVMFCLTLKGDNSPERLGMKKAE